MKDLCQFLINLIWNIAQIEWLQRRLTFFTQPFNWVRSTFIEAVLRSLLKYTDWVFVCRCNSVIKTKCEYHQKFINTPNKGISWFALILVFFNIFCSRPIKKSAFFKKALFRDVIINSHWWNIPPPLVQTQKKSDGIW